MFGWVSIGVTNFGVRALFSFGGYGLALAAFARVVFGAYNNYPFRSFNSPLGWNKTFLKQRGLRS